MKQLWVRTLLILALILMVGRKPTTHQKQRGQQVNAGCCPPLFHSEELLSALLYPTLGLPTWEAFGPVGASPNEDHRDHQGSPAPLLWRQAESWDFSAWRSEGCGDTS